MDVDPSRRRTGRFAAALREAARAVDVPGAPLTLRIDRIDPREDGFRLSWSFTDPEVPPSEDGRLRGSLVVRPRPEADVHDVARAAWARAQLDAGRRFKDAVDGEWIPGEPVRSHRWSVQEAWQALVDHLSASAGQVDVLDGEIRVTYDDERSVYRIDPEEWAAYLNQGESADPKGTYIVPAAAPLEHGLPSWAAFELMEEEGAHGPVVALIEGRIVGLGEGTATS